MAVFAGNYQIGPWSPNASQLYLAEGSTWVRKFLVV